MAMRVPIFTIFALTVFCALQPRAKTLTIFFLAHWFFTRTFSNWSQCRDSFKMLRVSEIGHHLSFIDLLIVSGSVSTTRTNTIAIAFSPIGKTFTVKFQTSNFWAFTAMMSSLPLGMDILLFYLSFLDFGWAFSISPLLLMFFVFFL